MAEVDAEALSNDPSYQPYHDIKPPPSAANLSNPTPPMDPSAEDEDPIQPPKDFTEHFPSRLPVPPFIHVQGVPNFRDLGGYRCPPPPSITIPSPEKTYMVRKNILFRCAHPTQLTHHGASTLRNLGITNIYDLRSAPEIDKLAHTPPASPTETQLQEAQSQPNNTPTPTSATSSTTPHQPPPLDTSQGYIIIPSIPRAFTPVYAREDYSPVALARKLQWYIAANSPDASYSAGFVNAYRDIASYGATGGAYSTILRQTLRAGENMQRNPTMGRRRRPTSAVPTLDFLIGYQEEDESTASASPSVSTSTSGHANAVPASTTSPTTNTTGPDAPPEKKDGGLIFHCTAGKDRTGVLAAVILSLLRVDPDAICWEYAITEPGLGSWRDLFIERISRGGLGGPNRERSSTTKSDSTSGLKAGDAENADSNKSEKNAAMGGGPNLLSKAEAARICSSRASNMRAFLEQVLEAEFGGAERYLVEHVGLTAEEVGRLKEVLVVEVVDVGEVVAWEGVRIEGWTVEGGMEDDFGEA